MPLPPNLSLLSAWRHDTQTCLCPRLRGQPTAPQRRDSPGSEAHCQLGSKLSGSPLRGLGDSNKVVWASVSSLVNGQHRSSPAAFGPAVWEQASVLPRPAEGPLPPQPCPSALQGEAHSGCLLSKCALVAMLVPGQEEVGAVPGGTPCLSPCVPPPRPRPPSCFGS